jgi:hypothetical protein
LVVADLTGQNPNVFYELAIAHGYQRPVVHLQQRDEQVPFDVQDMRVIPYDVTDLDSVDEAMRTVAAYAETALADPGSQQTPLSSLERFAALRNPSNVSDAQNALVLTLEQLLTRIQSIEYELRERPHRGALEASPIDNTPTIVLRPRRFPEQEICRLAAAVGDAETVYKRAIERLAEARVSLGQVEAQSEVNDPSRVTAREAVQTAEQEVIQARALHEKVGASFSALQTLD